MSSSEGPRSPVGSSTPGSLLSGLPGSHQWPVHANVPLSTPRSSGSIIEILMLRKLRRGSGTLCPFLSPPPAAPGQGTASQGRYQEESANLQSSLVIGYGQPQADAQAARNALLPRPRGAKPSRLGRAVPGRRPRRGGSAAMGVPIDITFTGFAVPHPSKPRRGV